MKDSITKEDPMSACYIDQSFPALLHFSYKYADSPEKAILANANAGGENVARGGLLGALLGATHGPSAWDGWMRDGLHSRKEIEQEIKILFNL